MGTDNGYRLLWADDDIGRRFVYNRYRLEEEGWRVEEAPHVLDAARKLSEEDYDFILLDQMYPFSAHAPADDVWGGCRLLYWLKGRTQPRVAGPVPSIEQLGKLSPRKSNQQAPLMFLSSFDDPAVRKALHEVVPDFRLETKPIFPEQLLTIIRELRQPAFTPGETS